MIEINDLSSEGVNMALDINPKFSDARDVFGETRIITSFSHLNPNLPNDEVYGNRAICEMFARLDLDNRIVFNTAYDNAVAERDKPPGHKLQFGPINPVVMNPQLTYNRQRKIQSIPGDKIVNVLPAFSRQDRRTAEERLDNLLSVIKRHQDSANSVTRSLLELRRGLLGLIHPDLKLIPEVEYSGMVANKTIHVLEILENNGYPFWEMPLDHSWEKVKSNEITFLVRGINKKEQVCDVKFNGKSFTFLYDTNETKEIFVDDVYAALYNEELIPTVPVIVLGLVTAPQLIHIGGAQWKKYAPGLIELQANWLGIEEYRDLALTTGGYEPYAVVNRYDLLLKGFFVNYLHFGNNLANILPDKARVLKFGIAENC